MDVKRNSIKATIVYKIPFFFIGAALGMILVWVAFQWVPAAVVAARAVTGG